MATIWYEPYLRDRLRMVAVCMKELLRYVVLGFIVACKFDIQI